MTHCEITNRANNLPYNAMQKEGFVHRLNYNEKRITLIGIDYTYKESSGFLESIIEKEKPDVVCLELSPQSYEALKQKNKWRETDIIRVIRGKRTLLLISQLLSSSIEKMIAQKFGIQRDESILRIIAAAEENKVQILPAEMEIRISFLRTWRRLPFIDKLRLVSEMFFSLFIKENFTEEDLKKLKEESPLELSMRAITDRLPKLKIALLDERNQYTAHVISNVSGRKVVAVMGAKYVTGVANYIGNEKDVTSLLEIPPVNSSVRMIGWASLAFVIFLFTEEFFFSAAHANMGIIMGWSAVTASFSGLGALLILAHPVTIIASALAAPITTLHPLIAAGWVAAITEVIARKPRVKDFLDLAVDIISIRGFFVNRITRPLLLVAVVNLTTAIGTFVAIPLIMRFL